MPPTPSQRSLLSEFTQITGVPERTATRLLKSSGWKLEEACNSYFQSNALGGPPQVKEREILTKLFESYRSTTDYPNMVGVEGTMKYFQNDLGVNLENMEVLIPCEIIQVPAMGEMSKEGFVEGWMKLGLETIPSQRAYVANAIATISTDEELFRRVYEYTFLCSRERGHKAFTLDIAMVYWTILFSAPGKAWKTGSTDWLQLWLEFLKQNWTKSVNRDMWNQTYVFHLKTMQDESLSFWNEDGAWPSVIDEFVGWAKQRDDSDGAEKMEID